jgi:succinate dehydrogenase / fumarate reductase, cytochrome b subunit
MATAQHPAAPPLRIPSAAALSRCAPARAQVLPLAQAALAARHHPHRRLPAEHLLSNFEALKGPIAYGAQVKFLNSLPLVRVLEWVFIFLPILYHGVYGVYIWLRGKSNIVYYPWAGNWMYVASATPA